MARHWKVQDVLSEEDWRPFHSLLQKRRTTISRASAWLLGRGYRISRGAIANYIRSYRMCPAVEARRQIGGGSDATVRRNLSKHIARLSGADLTAVACFVWCWRQMHSGPEVGTARQLGEAHGKAEGVLLTHARRSFVGPSRTLKTE